MEINFLLVFMALLLVGKVIGGFKKGIVKEIISLVTLIFVCVVAGLVAKGVSSYSKKQLFSLLVIVIILGLVGILHHLLGIVFFSAKLISKLPVIHFADKLLGAVFGALEVVVLLWTVYCLTMTFVTGPIAGIVESYTRDSEILTWLYSKNLLAYFIGL